MVEYEIWEMTLRELIPLSVERTFRNDAVFVQGGHTLKGLTLKLIVDETSFYKKFTCYKKDIAKY